MSTQVTLQGRLTKDPELRFTAAGKAVAAFSVVSSRRFKNQQTGEWEDKDTSFYDCSAFGPMAENICESAAKGVGVIVTGNMHQEEYEKDGEKRRPWKVIVDDFAVSCKWKTVTIGEGASNASSNGAVKTYNDEPPF